MQTKSRLQFNRRERFQFGHPAKTLDESDAGRERGQPFILGKEQTAALPVKGRRLKAGQSFRPDNPQRPLSGRVRRGLKRPKKKFPKGGVARMWMAAS